MDTVKLHQTYISSGIAAAASALVAAIAADGVIKTAFTSSHAVDAIRAATDITSPSTAPRIDWPRAVATLAKRQPGAGES